MQDREKDNGVRISADDKPVQMRSLSPGHGVAGWIARFASGEERMQVTFDDIPGDWVYEVHGRLVDGKPGVTSLTIAPRDPDNPMSLTKATVTGTPIGTVIDRVRDALLQAWDRHPDHLADAIPKHPPKEGRSWPPEHFLQVAWWAIEAELNERSPRKAIADEWGVDGDTATRWLAEARRLGYYATPSGQPKPGTDTWAEATRILEWRVFEMVLVKALNYPAPDEAPIAELLATALKRPTPFAEQLRTENFFCNLVDLAYGDSRDPVRRAATALLAALEAASPIGVEASTTGDRINEPEQAGNMGESVQPNAIITDAQQPSEQPGLDRPWGDGRQVLHRIVENGLTFAYSCYTRQRHGVQQSWVESRQQICDDIHAGYPYYVVAPDGSETLVHVADDHDLAATVHGHDLLNDLPEVGELPGQDRATFELYREHPDLFRAMRAGLR
ncbi:hypothetical protein [Streptomyces nitrosporeus]|uniref:hypothetical protein n=1 Tax=Streptomyces nitrosporeus TaxID=28894 RepID=UPI00332582F7